MRTMKFPIAAREIAGDIARELNNDSGEGSYHGVFVAAGLEPTQRAPSNIVATMGLAAMFPAAALHRRLNPFGKISY